MCSVGLSCVQVQFRKLRHEHSHCFPLTLQPPWFSAQNAMGSVRVLDAHMASADYGASGLVTPGSCLAVLCLPMTVALSEKQSRT